MKWYLTNSMAVEINCADVIEVVARFVGLKVTDIQQCQLHRQSVDARNKHHIYYNCSYRILTAKTPVNAKPYTKPVDWLRDVEPWQKKQ